jgi:hypothetical protein
MQKGEILEITISVRITEEIPDPYALQIAARSVEDVLTVSPEGLAALLRSGQARRLASGVAIRSTERRLRRAFSRTHRPTPPHISDFLAATEENGCYTTTLPGSPVCTCSPAVRPCGPCPVHGYTKPL